MITEAEFRTSVLPFTLRYEGGWSDNPKDPGNWTGGKVGLGELRGTNFGIAAASHPHLDIRNLTRAEAADIYWHEYCLASGFNLLPLPLCAVVFDAGVMSGPGRAKGWLADARKAPALKNQIAAVSAERLAFCRSRSTWHDFGDGWGKRIAACQKRGLQLAAAAPIALPLQPAPAPKSVTKPALGRKPAAEPPIAPKPAHQPDASLAGQFLRVLLDALFSPLLQGAHR